MANRLKKLKTPVKYYCRASLMNQLCVNWSLTKPLLGRPFFIFSQSSLQKEWRALSRVLRLRLSVVLKTLNQNFLLCLPNNEPTGRSKHELFVWFCREPFIRQPILCWSLYLMPLNHTQNAPVQLRRRYQTIPLGSTNLNNLFGDVFWKQFQWLNIVLKWQKWSIIFRIELMREKF